MIGKFTKDSLTAATAPILIEDNVLIGARWIILKGVTIGARSIIAAGSVVKYLISLLLAVFYYAKGLPNWYL